MSDETYYLMRERPDRSGAITDGLAVLVPMPWCVAHDGRPFEPIGPIPECDNDPDGSDCDIRTDHTSGIWREVRRATT